jgi:hypothetical protein
MGESRSWGQSDFVQRFESNDVEQQRKLRSENSSRWDVPHSMDLRPAGKQARREIMHN